MLIQITCEGPHAGAFGYLLHKNPASIFERELAFGKVTVFYPETSEERVTVALLLEVDPLTLVRGPNRAAALDQYVNDRPYVASSLTSVALREAFSSALAGRSRDRPELVSQKLPLSAKIPAVVARGGAAVIERLFAPLGYAVKVASHPLDATFPDWGDAGLVSLEIEGQQTVHDLLSHLYVLMPVLDAEKHYFVGEAEVEKLLGHGEGWLATHPEKLLITNRYLKYRRDLVRDALSQLTVHLAESDEEAQVAEDSLEERVNLADQRMAAVLSALRSGEPPMQRVIDLGCGEGRLLKSLIEDRAFTEIVGVDVSPDALAKAERRLKLDRLPPAVRERVKLMQGSALYRDRRLEGFDAIALVEMIEHVEEDRLDVLTKVVFRHLKPRRIVVTTPNAEYNVLFPTLGAGKMRHRDHRFEWSRSQFRSWCEQSSDGYTVRYADVGPADQAVGPPTQMAVFDRRDG